jgi:hypothetical protein
MNITTRGSRRIVYGLMGLGALVAHIPNAHADDAQLDLAGANDTYITSPTGDYLSYPGYLTTSEQLYLAPLGDTGPYTPLDLPTDSYDYAATVPQGEAQVVSTVLADYDDGKLSAAHPDVLFGYSDSSVMISGAESTLAADGVPTQDVDIVLIGDTSNPVVGYIADWVDNPSNAWLVDLLGLQDLEGIVTPDNLYPTDIYTIDGDQFGDYAGYNAWTDGLVHEMYDGLTSAQIESLATETTTGLTNSFNIDLPTADFTTAIWDAITNVYG